MARASVPGAWDFPPAAGEDSAGSFAGWGSVRGSTVWSLVRVAWSSAAEQRPVVVRTTPTGLLQKAPEQPQAEISQVLSVEELCLAQNAKHPRGSSLPLRPRNPARYTTKKQYKTEKRCCEVYRTTQWSVTTHSKDRLELSFRREYFPRCYCGAWEALQSDE